MTQCDVGNRIPFQLPVHTKNYQGSIVGSE